MITQPASETLWETYLAPWKKYAQFSGRASRKEYWTFSLLNGAIYLAFVIANALLDRGGEPSPLGALVSFAYIGFWLATFVPSLAVSVRRLHDTDRSGWWLIPCMICGIILLVFGLQEGDHGPNQYGPDPYDEGNNYEPWRLEPPTPEAYQDLNSPRPMETWRTRDDE
jgi:uncharacterized membrane protein YhaH (DUF805 family)